MQENLTFEPNELRSQLENFMDFEWVKKQSFCWRNLQKVDLIKTLTMLGICLKLNNNFNVLNYEK